MRFIVVENCDGCPFMEEMTGQNFRCLRNMSIYYYSDEIPVTCELITANEIIEAEKEFNHEQNLESN